jgi:type II secretory pathway pseudopilin PulG
MKKTNGQKGITLVALVITIIILLILATISIQALTNTGLFQKANEAKEKTKNATENQATILNEYEDELNKYISGNVKTLQADGSWNSSKKVNSPQLMEGMTGIYWDESGKEVEVNVDNQDNWYDYSAQKWANAVTKDSNGNITGYWVWIPRYAYKIETNRYTNTVGKISVKFLQGTTNKDESNAEISTAYPETTGATMSAYVVHPSFINGTLNHYMNGEWDKEISGYWVAKYPAGFQANTITNNNGTLSTTISNSSDTVVYSNKNYTSYNANMTTNALSQNLTSSGYASQKLSYPVFKPLTYAYNNISTGDAYTISKEIASASSFYGLNSTKTDSHQMKNSEWGAVAYLTQSSCGRNETEVNLNNYYTTESSPWRTAITGMCTNGTSGSKSTTLGNAYNTTVGVKGSSTANVTGIYDLNGCVWERTAAYISNGNASLSSYGKSYANTTANANGYQTLSTKWATVYPYNSSSDSYTNNYSVYSGKKSTTYGFGDAVLETSTTGSGSPSWNGDCSDFPGPSSPFFGRGGCYGDTSLTGLFAFDDTIGGPYYDAGFRSVLVIK